MASDPQGDITRLLNCRDGEPRNCERLAELLYKELRRLAARAMVDEPSGHTLQATAVAHDAYLKLIDQSDISWQSRAHFFAVASRTMRHMLVDYGRKRRSLKRGGSERRVDLEEAGNATTVDCDELLNLDQALNRLEAIDKRQLAIVELRYFGGLTEDEVANVLAISPRTVKREWKSARLWLHAELTRPRSSSGTRSSTPGQT
ncbi:MAG TPA: ECF-type sigma factor [Bryobacteraceae bacterium]|nr:ECF-type sigma factor [Bryobacteraceae bacterium]